MNDHVVNQSTNAHKCKCINASFLSSQRSTCRTSLLRSPPPLEPVSQQSSWPRVTTPTVCASCPLRWACTAWASSTGACTCRAAPSSSLWGHWVRAGLARWGPEVQDWREHWQESQVRTEHLIQKSVHYMSKLKKLILFLCATGNTVVKKSFTQCYIGFYTSTFKMWTDGEGSVPCEFSVFLYLFTSWIHDLDERGRSWWSVGCRGGTQQGWDLLRWPQGRILRHFLRRSGAW